jgi:hypothetical protein
MRRHSFSDMQDACMGDSGAPAFTEVDGVAVVVGVVSWAVGCAKKDRPGVYTRVSSYRQWIEATIAGVQWPLVETPDAPSILPTAVPAPDNASCRKRCVKCLSATLVYASTAPLAASQVRPDGRDMLLRRALPHQSGLLRGF